MSLRLWGTSSGWGSSAGAVIPALGSGRYSPGPNIVLPSWLKDSAPNCTINVFWGQPGALATVSTHSTFLLRFRQHMRRVRALAPPCFEQALRPCQRQQRLQEEVLCFSSDEPGAKLTQD